jgi:Phage portal protein
MSEPGSWWLRKAPKLTPGASNRHLQPRGGQPLMRPNYHSSSGNMAGGQSAPLSRSPTQPIDPFGWNNGLHSQYRQGRPDTPPAVLRDVDVGTNFYSPFQPIAPFAPPTGNYAREWDYPTAVNLDYQPKRFAMFQQLRLMSQSWGLLRAVIETRKDQLLVVPWAIQGRDGSDGGKKADELREFFRKPDRKRRFSQWARLILEDLFIIDAPCIYIWKTEGDKVHALEVVDGATILPLVDDAGRTPDWPSAAYQQIIKGLPSINLTERELLYAPMRPRPELPVYGYSPVEQIYLETTEGIRRTLYQVNFWTEGSLPDMMITVPDAWTPQQIAMFQSSFDALMSGNAYLKSKVRFVPGGMKPFDIKNASGEALKTDYDEWLARIVCYAFSVNSQPFVKQMNRATAEVSEEVAKEEGTQALQAWFKNEIMDPLIQETFGCDDLEFVWKIKPPVDPLEQAQVAEIQVRNGMRSVNEVRKGIGLESMRGADGLMIYTANGAVQLGQTEIENAQGAE